MLLGDAHCLAARGCLSREELDARFPQGYQGFEQPDSEPLLSGQLNGCTSQYGRGVLTLIRSLIEHDGFHHTDYARSLLETPEDEECLDEPTSKMRRNFQLNSRNPFEHSDYQDGSDDEGLINVTRLAPLVAVHATDDELPALLNIFTRVLQQSDRAVAYANLQAKILRQLWQGISPEEVFSDQLFTHSTSYGFDHELSRKLQEAIMALEHSGRQAAMEFGNEGMLICAFPLCIHTFLKNRDSWSEAFHACALAGGDTSGRAAWIGSWLGASLGFNSIPTDWLNKLAHKEQINNNIHQLLHLIT